MKKQESDLKFSARHADAFVLLAIFMMLTCAPLFAQDDLEKPPAIPPATVKEAPLPPKIQNEQLEPAVTIREEEDRRVEEYRRNGQVYMIKVIPDKGVPYYYVDTDGDGKLELDLDQQALNPVQPVHWKIKEWD